MIYPLKFFPVYKDYVWGGRELANFGKSIPEGLVAESWEMSCHPDGVSVISNGEYRGKLLTEIIKEKGTMLVGTGLCAKHIEKFPLLIKLIDANDNLSVQVHPDDSYAQSHENGEYGKNEVWYVLNANKGAKLVCGLSEGVTREVLEKSVNDGNVENCLNYMEVMPGDVINVPAGLVHAIGKGLLIAEIQQSSNVTYRIYDYDRIDKNGNKRPLHIEKALEVIRFIPGKVTNPDNKFKIRVGSSCFKTCLVSNKYFSVELYEANGRIEENADGRKFFAYLFIDGEGEVIYSNGRIKVDRGETVLIPAALGEYTICGRIKAIKTYVSD